MTRVYIADSLLEERLALRLLLLDLEMIVVGQASDWLTTFNLAPLSTLNMLIIDSDLLLPNSNEAINSLRLACPEPVVIVLISHLQSAKHALISSGADAIISKSDTPDIVVERLKAAAKILPTDENYSAINSS